MLFECLSVGAVGALSLVEVHLAQLWVASSLRRVKHGQPVMIAFFVPTRGLSVFNKGIIEDPTGLNTARNRMLKKYDLNHQPKF